MEENKDLQSAQKVEERSNKNKHQLVCDEDDCFETELKEESLADVDWDRVI